MRAIGVIEYGGPEALREVAIATHGGQAWIRTRDEIIDGGWLGR